MQNLKIKKYITTIIVFSSLIVVAKNAEARDLYPPEYFSISIICLDTEPMRNVWAEILAHELRKIGIGVNSIESLSYEEIAQRTCDYEGTYPTPSHYEGGYDLIFMDRNWDLDIDPTPYFQSNSTIPFGENIYQYENQNMDWALGNFTKAPFGENWIYAEQIQNILYDELPAITILYDYVFYYMTENISGINTLLWNKNAETMANWNHPTKTEMNYGINYEFENFHPILSKITKNSNDFQWLNHIFDSLIEHNSQPPYNGAFSPKIAANISSTNGITFYIDLDPKAKWADGITLNATDVKYSFDLFENLTKPENWNSIVEWNSNEVTIIDEFTIEIAFQNNNTVYAESKLDIPILPFHIWKDFESNVQGDIAKNWMLNNPEKIIGAGPYKLESYDETNKKIHLVKNPYYQNLTHAVDPIISDVHFIYQPSKEAAINELATGRIDMIDYNFQIYPKEIDLPNLYNKTILDYRSEEIAVNMKHPYLSGTLTPISSDNSGMYLRRAISHVLPRNHIIKTVLDDYAEPGITPWPINAPYTNEDLEPYEYSVEKAIEYMVMMGAIDRYYYSSSEAGIAFSTIFCAVCVVIVSANYLKIKSKKKT